MNVIIGIVLAVCAIIITWFIIKPLLVILVIALILREILREVLYRLKERRMY